ncbi:hypothetical protein BN1013_00757 [Candidatus Rubidus massiliensis]|nr:hypothetical protein BN1013_00757 [Candidatus Rubidus massiliensis]
MTSFISYSKRLERLLTTIVSSVETHAKWLNTLSFLENCGARKIAACEHPTLVKEEMLKHAAEEFRHAHYLKRQIGRITDKPFYNYARNQMLGDMTTLHYLTALNLKTSWFLKNTNQSKTSIKEISYLLVTYAIELRAQELYLLYDKILRQNNSPITIKSILLEENEHLKEMKEELKKFTTGSLYAEYVCAIESDLCKEWIKQIEIQLNIEKKE